jgi:hypothetical protein
VITDSGDRDDLDPLGGGPGMTERAAVPLAGVEVA